MPVFFITPDQVQDTTVTIKEPALLNHLRASLRVREGETLRVTIEGERRYLVRVMGIERKLLRGLILEESVVPPRSHPRISLGQALLKGDHMDWLIQKTAELGIASLTPLISIHTVVRPNHIRMESQQRRWQRIALEAAQQSEQWEIPKILSPTSGKDFFERKLDGAVNLLLAERWSGQSLTSIVLPGDPEKLVRIAIGPEGGWTQEEFSTAIDCGFAPVSMGERILRAETAAIAAVTILQSRLGELG